MIRRNVNTDKVKRTQKEERVRYGGGGGGMIPSFLRIFYDRSMYGGNFPIVYSFVPPFCYRAFSNIRMYG